MNPSEELHDILWKIDSKIYRKLGLPRPVLVESPEMKSDSTKYNQEVKK